MTSVFKNPAYGPDTNTLLLLLLLDALCTFNSEHSLHRKLLSLSFFHYVETKPRRHQQRGSLFSAFTEMSSVSGRSTREKGSVSDQEKTTVDSFGLVSHNGSESFIMGDVSKELRGDCRCNTVYYCVTLSITW